MPSYLPVTIDGSEIPADAPRSQGMDDAHAQAVVAKAEEYRDAVLHLHFDLVGHDITVYAANVGDDQPVAFNFGDGSMEVTEDSVNAQATATHTYASDGVFLVGVRTRTDRWFTEAVVPAPPAPEPPEEL